MIDAADTNLLDYIDQTKTGIIEIFEQRVKEEMVKVAAEHYKNKEELSNAAT
jgi:hypothetical protein